jgi:chemotaxis protein MotB
MKADRKGSGNRQNVIIKKEEVVEGEAHGGAWKVAYADFVTAMMAFFLLMWLLNATTEDQRKGLADYFSPSNQLSHASSGTGDPFGGHTAFDQGALVSDRGAVQAVDGNRPTPIDPSDPVAQPYAPARTASDDDQDPGAGAQAPPSVPPVPAAISATGAIGATGAIATPTATTVPAAVTAPATPSAATPPMAMTASGGASTEAGSTPPGAAAAARSISVSAAASALPRAPTEAELRAAQERREKAEFAQAAQQIRDAVRNDPALADLARQLAIDITPQGLRIQILDEEHRPMFALGSAAPNERAMLLLQKVTPVLARLSQDISIAGNTDATPFPGPDRTNWELSTDRANATRRLLVEGGLPDSRIRSVTGNADRDPLLPADPLAAANRRIAIVVLRTARPAETAPGAVEPASNPAAAGAGLAANPPGNPPTNPPTNPPGNPLATPRGNAAGNLVDNTAVNAVGNPVPPTVAAPAR